MDVIRRQTPAPHPLTLTRSQEVAFNNVERLQAALEASMKLSSGDLTESQDLSTEDRSSGWRSESSITEQCHGPYIKTEVDAVFALHYTHTQRVVLFSNFLT